MGREGDLQLDDRLYKGRFLQRRQGEKKSVRFGTLSSSKHPHPLR